MWRVPTGKRRYRTSAARTGESRKGPVLRRRSSWRGGAQEAENSKAAQRSRKHGERPGSPCGWRDSGRLRETLDTGRARVGRRARRRSRRIGAAAGARRKSAGNSKTGANRAGTCLTRTVLTKGMSAFGKEIDRPPSLGAGTYQSSLASSLKDNRIR